MLFSRAAMVAAALLAAAPAAEARSNSSGAMSTFLLTDCDECTRGQKDAIFCTEAESESNYVSNGTFRYTIKLKKDRYGPAFGTRFCWEGAYRPASGARARTARPRLPA